ncbi:MAG TPA: hypothetical protein GXX51_04995 [Firmicutes bacterium]|nr:hypothetical protein [Bacillota bacterium]
MSQETERFLDAEKRAEELVSTLTALQKEVLTYQTATRELEAVRQRLLQFITSSERTAVGIHESIELLKSIGSPEILSRLDALKKEQTNQFSIVLAAIAKMEAEIGSQLKSQSQVNSGEHSGILEAVTRVESELGGEAERTSNEHSAIREAVAEIGSQLSGESKEKSGEHSSILGAVNGVRTLVFVTLGVSVAALAISALVLLR